MPPDENYFNLELPEAEKDSKADDLDLGAVGRVIGIIVLILGGIGLVLVSLPIIICGGTGGGAFLFLGIFVIVLGIASIYKAIKLSNKKK